MRKLLLVAWLPALVFLLPLPPEAARQLQDEVRHRATENTAAIAASQIHLDVLTSGLWTVWMQDLALLVMGLAVGVVAWRRYRYWQWLAAGMSILYLTLVTLSYLFMERTIPDHWLFFETQNHFLRVVQANFRIAEVGLANGSVMRPARLMYGAVLMPIFQLTVLAWLAARIRGART
jgi:hypothetical protein